jgi:hypothetical protein
MTGLICSQQKDPAIPGLFVRIVFRRLFFA